MSPPLIIVGGGAAGCVIAARATERAEREVILVEAGPDYPDPGTLPRDLIDGGRNSMTKHDWRYKHRPTTGQYRFPFPRGRVVGGSSAVNTCIALRGQPEDYDEWAARGLPEWSWAKCLPAFVRLENDLDFGSANYHGDAGPLPVRRYSEDDLVPWQSAFLEACDLLGLPRCADSNRPGSAGAGPHAMNKLEERRVSAADAWLTPEVRARENLTIVPRTRVVRVLFEGRRAVGVEVLRGRQLETIEGGEVVLCAGAIGSPGILLRSGVGPSDELERLAVEPVARVEAIGARLLDHHGAAFFLKPRFRAPTSRRHPLIQTVYRYASSAGRHTSDMQIQPGARGVMPRMNLPLVSLMCAVGKPKGHGRLHWRSAKPKAKPVIESRVLEHDEDRAKAVEALTIAFELFETAPLQGLAKHFWPRRKTLADPARMDAWIRKSCDSGYHPCGTVPMGADDDPSAAADGRGRVRGVSGLRVADASLMPTVPSANTHLATLMIGERFGQWLRTAD